MEDTEQELILKLIAAKEAALLEFENISAHINSSNEKSSNCILPDEIFIEDGLNDTTPSSPKLSISPTNDSNQSECLLPKGDYEKPPLLIAGSWEEYQPTDKVQNNFLKGCKWSPDGSCLLTASEDRKLRLYDVYKLTTEIFQDEKASEFASPNKTELKALFAVNSPDLIYDYVWYPFMNSGDPATCCFLSTSRESPLHLYDAFNGTLRCSWRAFNHVEEFVAAHSVSFTPDGSQIICGYDKTIRIFDCSMPGKTCTTYSTYAKKSKRGIKGIVSCFDFHPIERDLVAVGTYNKNIGLFSLNSGSFQFRLDGQSGGLTSLKFSSCGTCIYAAGRKDNEILCYDIRSLGQILFSMHRDVNTNQRIQFDIDVYGQYLISGDVHGRVNVWDLNRYENGCFDAGMLPSCTSFSAHADVVNGVGLHPYLPILATVSGQRHFMEPIDENDIKPEKLEPNLENVDAVWRCGKSSNYDNSLKLWRFHSK